jgi:hypothetical protein
MKRPAYHELMDERPNVDFALVVLARVLGCRRAPSLLGYLGPREYKDDGQ